MWTPKPSDFFSGQWMGYLPDLQYAGNVAEGDCGFPKSIGAPATRALANAGYSDVSELVGVPMTELKKLHGIGPKALRILQEALEEHGQSLG
jgi:hypothetical protein